VTGKYGPAPHGEQAVPGEFHYWRDPEMDEWLALDPDTVPWSRAGPTGTAGGPPTVHTAEEAAEILKVKQSWLERQAAARKIPFTMLGGTYRFSDRHLAEIVQMNEVMPVPVARDAPPPPRRKRGTASPAVTTIAPLRPRPRNGPRHVA
jgi:excisionase family DNA binding protein